MNNSSQSIKVKSKFSQDNPTAYLKGYIEFYKLKFKVDSRVLIPRPETELLVDEVLAFVGSDPKSIKHDQNTKKGPTLGATILDIGTGSGNIAIALAKNLKKAKIFAIDISDDALEVAKENAKLNKVQNRIFFIKSDLLENLRGVTASGAPQREAAAKARMHDGAASRQDPEQIVIVANLPYIPRGRMPYLDPSVRDFEPWTALVGGADGFDLYRKLFTQIKEKNLNQKLIVAEIDHTHEILAGQEAKKYFPNAEVEVKTDLAQKQRVLRIKF